MKKKLNYIIQNQSEFTIDSQNFANEILVDEMINGSNFYVIKLSVCQFQNCDIVYGDFLKCRFKDCIFTKDYGANLILKIVFLKTVLLWVLNLVVPNL
jgi:uncharacterized protein YjbI with pentapeptide repeats